MELALRFALAPLLVVETFARQIFVLVVAGVGVVIPRAVRGLRGLQQPARADGHIEIMQTGTLIYPHVRAFPHMRASPHMQASYHVRLCCTPTIEGSAADGGSKWHKRP
jgi:hypothetical protein